MHTEAQNLLQYSSIEVFCSDLEEGWFFFLITFAALTDLITAFYH